MKILFLAHRIPYPPNKGDKIRSFNELKYLSEKNTIYLGTILEEKSERQYIPFLEPYCKEIYTVCFNKKINLIKRFLTENPFTVSNFYDNSLQSYVDKIIAEKDIDFIICFSSSMAEYVFRNPLFKAGKLSKIKLIIDYIDLDSDKWLQYSKYTKFPLRQIYLEEKKRLFAYEIKINQAFDYSIFVSERETKIFKKLYPKARNIIVIPNGIDFEYFTPPKKKLPNRQPSLVFTGVMDYFANIDGVKWFCKNILPKIKVQIPDIRFYIVGMKPTKAVRKLSKLEGVIVTGFIDDIRQYYWMADVCVIPLRIARGLQNKLLEAMATGNAVVATSNAKNGIVCRENLDLLIADDEEGFCQCVISILQDAEKKGKLGMNAEINIRKNYSWQHNLSKFDSLLS